MTYARRGARRTDRVGDMILYGSGTETTDSRMLYGDVTVVEAPLPVLQDWSTEIVRHWLYPRTYLRYRSESTGGRSYLHHETIGTRSRSWDWYQMAERAFPNSCDLTPSECEKYRQIRQELFRPI